MYKDCNILLKICFNIIKIAPTKAHYSTSRLPQKKVNLAQIERVFSYIKTDHMRNVLL